MDVFQVIGFVMNGRTVLMLVTKEENTTVTATNIIHGLLTTATVTGTGMCTMARTATGTTWATRATGTTGAGIITHGNHGGKTTRTGHGWATTATGTTGTGIMTGKRTI